MLVLKKTGYFISGKVDVMFSDKTAEVVLSNSRRYFFHADRGMPLKINDIGQIVFNEDLRLPTADIGDEIICWFDGYIMAWTTPEEMTTIQKKQKWWVDDPLLKKPRKRKKTLWEQVEERNAQQELSY